MKLRELLKDVSYELVQGDLDIEISDIAYDSRKVNESTAFVALKGFRVNGHDYIDKAIELGCKVIIVCEDVNVDESITVIKLEDTRVDLSKISRTLFGYPDKEMTTITVTGTKGKTTTSSMIKKVLDDSGNTCGIIGTLGVSFLDKYYHTVNTSPESYDVFKYMREMLDNGVKYLVMEISSQSLKLKRWSNVIFDYAIFTNLSLDHVGDDEHDSFEDYMYCKSLLFKQARVGIFNIDSEYYDYMTKDATCNVYSFGYNDKADYRLVSTKNILTGNFIGIDVSCDGKVKGDFRVSIPGDFTAYNAIACISICDMLGIDMNSVKRSLEDVFVKGRLEPVKISNKFNVLIDYAYQGVAMENVLKTIKLTNPKRIVSMFGCGGNRAKSRRYEMGEVSSRLADLTVVTSDNPRDEDPMDIINDILIGVKKADGAYVTVPDRKEAIKYCMEHAQDGDIIVLAGKGHEDYQEIEGVKYPMDERVLIEEVLVELGWK